MHVWSPGTPSSASAPVASRMIVLYVLLSLVCGGAIWRLYWLQISKASDWRDRALDQHISADLIPAQRGDILLHDSNNTFFTAVSNQNVYLLYARPNKISTAHALADRLYAVLGLPVGVAESDLLSGESAVAAKQEAAVAEVVRLKKKMEKSDDPYEPLRQRVTEEQKKQIESWAEPGLGFVKQDYRFTPDASVGGQIFGFVTSDNDNRVGKYGIEGFYNQQLSGVPGTTVFERDARGNVISIGDNKSRPVENGASMLLTIDRQIQTVACAKLQEFVTWFEATGGSVVILEPSTGRIIALCNVPDYSPVDFGQVSDLDIFNNAAIFRAYEPGSVMKPLTMAAALNEGKVEPTDTYTDEGQVKIDNWTIKNSDLKAHGVQTMTQILEQSLNTGAIYAMRQVGPEVFRRYMSDFGFGTLTGVDLDHESPGNMMSLEKKGEIFAATASYGQGMTATPIQLASAFAAVINGGTLYKPYIVDEVQFADGRKEKKQPQAMRQVVSDRTSKQIAAMLVSVVNNGHGQSAKVPGYRIGGKTGTAQIPKAGGGGYEADGPGSTIGTFVGFAPFDQPRFVMLTKIERPHKVQFADQSAAPLFKEIASFILRYYGVPKEE